MAVTLKLSYQGNLRCQAKEAPGGAAFVVEPPAASGGSGKELTPYDLLGFSYGSCVTLVTNMWARAHELDLTGMEVEVQLDLTKEKPTKVAGIRTVLTLPRKVRPVDLKKLKRVAELCPIHQSLHPGIKKSIKLVCPK